MIWICPHCNADYELPWQGGIPCQRCQAVLAPLVQPLPPEADYIDPATGKQAAMAPATLKCEMLRIRSRKTLAGRTSQRKKQRNQC